TAPFRAVMGQSMGGFGSLFFGVKHPELFGAYAGDSSDSLWLVTTNLASPPVPGEFPDGNPMYTLNAQIICELPPDNTLSPDNGDDTFGIYGYCGAFSPINQGLGQCDPPVSPACRSNPPFCVAYPFVVLPPSNPQLLDTAGTVTCAGGRTINKTLVPNQPII